MTHELELQLQSRYPFMTIKGSYCGYQPVRSPMDCQCGDGWYQIIDDLCAGIMQTLTIQQVTDLYIDQIKEKFGELRFYYSGIHHDLIDNLIDEAILKSKHTCEICGKEGKLRPDRGWVQTLCDEHA